MGIDYSVYIKTNKSLLEVKSCLEQILNSTLEKSEHNPDILGITLLGLHLSLLKKNEYKHDSDYEPLVQHDFRILIDYIRPAFIDSYKGEWTVLMAIILADMLSKNLYCESFVIKNSEEVIRAFSYNFLSEIFELKSHRVSLAKSKRNLEELKQTAITVRENVEKHRLRSALKREQINIIAEIKRASPSKGVINDKIDVAEVAKIYENGGACAISVLTEEDRFKGNLKDLKTARNAVNLPILRKDFIFDEFQIYEAAEAGADVILLIAAMLDDETLIKLHNLAEEDLGLDALVEVHTLEELERVKKTNAKIIGINNRDLHTFKVSLDVSKELIKHAPKDALMITESGITTKDEILKLRELGFAGFLIGETLMRSGNVAEEMKNLTT